MLLSSPIASHVKLSLLITDDHPLCMEGLALMLQRQNPSLRVYQAATLEAAKSYLKKDKTISLLLLDRTLPGVDSLKHLQAFWAIHPDLRIAIISGSYSRQNIKEAMDAGAAGFIPKNASVENTLAAIAHLLAGGVYIPQQLWDNPLAAQETKSMLTPRRLDVLALAVEGHSNKEIAHKLQLSEGTVKQHFNAIFNILQADNRAQAIHIAKMQGILY